MGQFVCYDRNSNSLVANTTLAVNDITNALTVDEGIDGGVNLLASCNDSSVRVLDIQTLRQKQHIHLPWPVNVSLFLKIKKIKIKKTIGSTPNKARIGG